MNTRVNRAVAGRNYACCILLLCLGALLPASCGLLRQDGRQEVSVVEAQLQPDGVTLSLWAGSCHGSPTLTIEEQDEEVRVAITADRPPQGETTADCADEVTATLESKLGNRVVIDQSSGDEVVVERMGG